MSAATRPGMVRAWDLPTRLFHWSLVLAVANAWASFRFAEAVGDATMKWHRYTGYAVLVLVVWRLLWGFAGSSTARWSQFVRAPSHAAGYALDLVRGRHRSFLGHNPLGTYMVLALLASVGVQGVLGLMTVEHNDVTWGPLYKLVSAATYEKIGYVHVRMLNYVIWPLAVFHVLANVLYGAIKKDPLVPAMLTGRKPAAPYEDEAEAVIVARPMLRASICLIAAGVLVFGSIAALGGKILY